MAYSPRGYPFPQRAPVRPKGTGCPSVQDKHVVLSRGAASRMVRLFLFGLFLAYLLFEARVFDFEERCSEYII
ncbi:MAG: hypothetical protein ACPGWR_25270 [Ardenticatenaceae bacterium]